MSVTTSPRTPGRNKTGQPTQRGSSTSEGRPDAADVAARTDAEQRERTDRHAAVTDIISLAESTILAPLAAIEQHRIGQDEVGSFTLDIVTIESHKAPLADAVVDLAESYPVLGAVLDKLAKATPFAALLSVTISLAAQLAENHRALPRHLRGLSPNLVDRDEFIQHLRDDAQSSNGQRKVRDNPQA